MINLDTALSQKLWMALWIQQSKKCKTRTSEIYVQFSNGFAVSLQG